MQIYFTFDSMTYFKHHFFQTVVGTMFLLVFACHVQAETQEERWQKFILSNQWDSINSLEYEKNDYIFTIIQKHPKVDYKSSFELILKSINNKNSNFVSTYISKHLLVPVELNLDYIRIHWVVLLDLKNKNKIEEANELYLKVNEYLGRFKENELKYKEAQAYLKTHTIVNQLIAENYAEGKSSCVGIIDYAKKIRSTELLIIGYYHLSDFLIVENNLEEYILVNELADSLSQNRSGLNPYKTAIKLNLANAYIFKKVEMDKVKLILSNLFKGSATREASYILYLQLIANLNPESITYKEILDTFKVKNLEELWDRVYSEVQQWENLPAKRNVVNQMITTFKNHERFEMALTCSNILSKIQQEIYSTELKNSVVALDLEEKKQELSEFTLATKQRQILFLIGFILLSAITGLLIWRFSVVKKKNTSIASKNNALLELNEIKNQFFTNVSHELRTPLTLIKGPLELALLQPHVPIEVEKLLHMCYKSSTKLETKINELLTLSKAENNRLTLKPTENELNHLISRICSPFWVIADSKKIELDIDLEQTKNLNGIMDEDHIETVINNLITNAIKFTPEGNFIKIKTERINENFVMFEIVNEGGLIDEGDFENIFKRFYQSNSGAALKGIGIGLALSRKLAHLMNGDLKVENTTNGPKFTFSFQLNQENLDNVIVTDGANQFVDSKKEPLILGNNYGKRFKLLIIEDDQDLSQYLVGLLQESFISECVRNGKEALNLLKSKSFDVILSDILMPEIDGIEFFEKMQKDPLIQETPILFLTAVSDLNTKVRAYDIGVEDYITKPFQAPELISRLLNKAAKANKDIGPQDLTEKWLGDLQRLIEANVERKDLNVEFLCEHLAITPKTLSRKLIKVADITPAAFIKSIRLEKGRELLLEKKFSSIKQISISVGFNRPDYFSKEFYKKYKVYPKDLL